MGFCIKLTGIGCRCTGIFNKMLDCLPKDILNIIITYKKDLELLEQIPAPYNSVASQVPFNIGPITPTDFIILHILELVHRVDLATIGLDQLIATPHEALVRFETATDLQLERLMLYSRDRYSLSPLWRFSLPYLIIDFLTTSDIFTLRERIESYSLTGPEFPYILLN